MKKSRSFVNRLTLKVLKTVLILMIVTLAMTFIAAYRSMRGETIGRYLGMRGVVSEKISLEIKSIEIGARNVADKVGQKDDRRGGCFRRRRTPSRRPDNAGDQMERTKTDIAYA